MVQVAREVQPSAYNEALDVQYTATVLDVELDVLAVAVVELEDVDVLDVLDAVVLVELELVVVDELELVVVEDVVLELVELVVDDELLVVVDVEVEDVVVPPPNVPALIWSISSVLMISSKTTTSSISPSQKSPYPEDP